MAIIGLRVMSRPVDRLGVSQKVALLVVVVAVAGVGGYVLLLGGLQPPVDVYARPTPASTADPESLFPPSVAGLALLSVSDLGGPGQQFLEATGTYEGSVLVRVVRWDSVGGAVSEMAELYENAETGAPEGATSNTTRFSSGDQDWFTLNGQLAGQHLSFFVWRKGVWVFLVRAPTETLRDQVVEGLSF